MKADTFKVTIHMVSSLDGIIAKKDNSVSWFETADHYEKGIAEGNAGGIHENNRLLRDGFPNV